MSKIIDTAKEKEINQQSKKKLTIAICVAAVAVITMLAVVAVGMFRDFDAQKYVRGVLDQTFKGAVEEIMTIVDGSSEEELAKQYEEGVVAFVENKV